MYTKLKYTVSDVKKFFTKTQENTVWVKEHNFQPDVVRLAALKFEKRAVGWFMHNNVWDESKPDAETLGEAWKTFEDKHFTCYRRWRKNVGRVSEDFIMKEDPSDDLGKKADRLFLFYLVYGECHDFRNLKHVLNLLYHVCVSKWEKGEKQIAEWIRMECNKLYRFLSLIYSNSEMTQQCFLHDDLDDLCHSSGFVKEFWKTKQFLDAFGLSDESKSKYPYLTKVITKLETPEFILYWQKGFQGDLITQESKNFILKEPSGGENGKEEPSVLSKREKWILSSFFEGKKEQRKTELEKQTKELESFFYSNILPLQKKQKASEEEVNKSESRNRPTEKTFENDATIQRAFSVAYRQYQSAKELLNAATTTETEGMKLANEAITKGFKDRKQADKLYGDSLKKLKQSYNDYDIAKKSFESAQRSFAVIDDCVNYSLESTFLKDKSEWRRELSKARIEKIEIQKELMYRYEDCLNDERYKFAKQWKTFFEKAGGPLGIWGYLTIIKHYSIIVYLHLLLLIPMSWLYFEYYDIFINGSSDQIQRLYSVDINDLVDLRANIILTSGAPIVLSILFFIFFNVFLAFRTHGKHYVRRDKGTGTLINLKGRFAIFSILFFTIITELVFFKFLVLNPLSTDTNEFTKSWDARAIVLFILYWVPVFILYFSSLQFIFSFWIGIYGLFYGLIDKVCNATQWSDMVINFRIPPDNNNHSSKKGDKDKNDSETQTITKLQPVVEAFFKSFVPHPTDSKLKQEFETKWTPERKTVAFAQCWNTIVSYFYDIHKISKEELQRYSYKIQSNPVEESADFLSGKITKFPDMIKPPQVTEAKEHLIRFVNNLNMKKPNQHIAVKEMIPLCVVTPVGAEKILYPYEFITHVDNTQNSFLQHLIDASPFEWENFKKKEAESDKARDWVQRLEKDILQGISLEKKRKKQEWIHDTVEGQKLKKRLIEWASIRFQALYRTVNGFMQAPRALEILARIQDPSLSQDDAQELVKKKFSYLIGYQSYARFEKEFIKSKDKALNGGNLSPAEIEAHDAVFNIAFLKEKFPELRIAYPDFDKGKHIGRMNFGNKTDTFQEFAIELYGPFGDMGLGKPTHQNFLSQFIDGLAIQTIDINQDSVISQSFFIPNVLAEFDADAAVKIIGLPEFIITTNWSGTAWCSAFGEKTFGTLVQRTYARLGIRLHYGHPDIHDALFIMTETGMSKLPYVSEDIFTGFDVVLKKGKIIHVEYHEVGKARDVDLYTTTKFQRKISMGGSQMACTRYIEMLQTSSNVSWAHRIGFFYSTVGFYLNHMLLYMSVWFALLSQLIIILIQRYILFDQVSTFISNRVFVFQIGYALVAPGVFQLMLENGIFTGLWIYISHAVPLAVYATFHILNISSYWQWGLTNSAFYLASGRGTGLEHYFMKDMYDTFYETHWKPAFVIFWMGIVVFIMTTDPVVWFVMFLIPSGIWLWGAMFLNPGSLPSTTHEEQWKRLMNKDMDEAKNIVVIHTNINEPFFPLEKRGPARLFEWIGRNARRYRRTLHWLYTVINFALLMRVIRFLGVLTVLLENVLSEKIPTFIWNDDRRRILRWDEEENRQKSVFYTSALVEDDDDHGAAANSEKNRKPGVSFENKAPSSESTAPNPNPSPSPAPNNNQGPSYNVPPPFDDAPLPQPRRGTLPPTPTGADGKPLPIPSGRASILKKDAKPSQRKLLRFGDDEGLTQPRPSRSILKPGKEEEDPKKLK